MVLIVVGLIGWNSRQTCRTTADGRPIESLYEPTVTRIMYNWHMTNIAPNFVHVTGDARSSRGYLRGDAIEAIWIDDPDGTGQAEWRLGVTLSSGKAAHISDHSTHDQAVDEAVALIAKITTDEVYTTNIIDT